MKMEEYFSDTFGDDGEDREFEDDGALHIVRDGTRWVFYNGQEKGMLMEKDIPACIEAVERMQKQEAEVVHPYFEEDGEVDEEEEGEQEKREHETELQKFEAMRKHLAEEYGLVPEEAVDFGKWLAKDGEEVLREYAELTSKWGRR